MIKGSKMFKLLIVVIVFFSTWLRFANAIGIYGKISPQDYLTGRFNPSNHGSFISLRKFSIPTNQRDHYLRAETVLALQRMYYAFRRQYPDIPFKLISTTRNYYSQKAIWMAKWNGKRLVDGKKLNRTISDPVQRALKILEYSSMPGTSRHHWGTDFDLNSLQNTYFESGDGKILYTWLCANASKYGFHQPYTAGRNRGYKEEKWHWSYVPISKKLLKDWNQYFDKDNYFFIKKAPVSKANVVYKLAPEYINAINPDCK